MLDKCVKALMLYVAKQEIVVKFGLGTKPKHKNIIGPYAFTYEVHHT